MEDISMNVYTCWYLGNYGYGCRTRSRKWMFVPELGQPDNKIYKNLTLNDLVFKNPFDRKLELDLERKLREFSLLRLIKQSVLPPQRLHTVGGLLFTTF